MLLKSAGKFTYSTTKQCGNVCPLSRKFKFPSVFCKLLFGCLLWQIQILLTWPPEAPSQGRTLMDPAADDLQSPWITGWLLKLSFKFPTSGKNINAFILNYSQTKLPYFQVKCIFSIPSHNNHITIWCDHKNHRLRKLKRRKLSLFI